MAEGRRGTRRRHAIEILLGLALAAVLLWAARGLGLPWPAPRPATAQPAPAGGAPVLEREIDPGYGSLSLAWSPDGTRLATGGPLSRPVTVWDAGSGARVWEIDARGPVHGLAWSADGRTLAVCGPVDQQTPRRDAARLLDARDGRLVRHLDRPVDRVGSGSAVAWSPRERRLAVALGVVAMVAVYDADSGRVVTSVPAGERTTSALAWSPDARRLAFGVLDHRGGHPVLVVDAAGGTLVARLGPHQAPAVSVAWSPDGRRLLVQERAGGAVIYAWPEGRPEHRRDGGHGAAAQAAFLPGGGELLLASRRSAEILRVGTWSPRLSITPPGMLAAVALDPGGRRLAAGGEPRIGIWRLAP
jgi:WD40 repeat protein